MKIAIIWLWYVWLPLAYHFAKQWFDVIWFDINEKRLEELRNWKDSTNEIWDNIKDVNIFYTSNPDDLKQAKIIIVTVPTPINKHKNPDFTPLIKASETIWKILQPWQIIVYESTVYPWCTEEICLPVLEKTSWLKCPKDFKIWYSPERINPGDKKHTVDKIVKVVAGIDNKTTDLLAEVYWKIITAWIHKAPSIKVAEAAKVIENTQRDINIALMNELSQIFNKIWINTYDVLEAAWTKWNFLKFTPGLVWWHCIWVDPYWLAYKAVEINHHPELILAWRRINDFMPVFVANQVIKLLIKAWKKVEWSKILILWLTFKENVPDFRNSKIADVIKELKEFGIQIKAYDPFYKHLNKHILEELNLEKEEITENLDWIYDGIVFAVNHKEFENLDLSNLLDSNWVIFDVKWKLRDKWFNFYKSL